MTRAKSKKATNVPQKMPDMRQDFLNLSAVEQQKVTNFFNMHNCAVFLYNQMTQKAKEYTDYCIQLSQEANKIEAKNEPKN